MSTQTGEVLNELFMNRLDTEEGKNKVAALGADWIRDRLREEGFARGILPPKTVTRADLQVSVNHDTLVKIVETEPSSRAMSMSFRGQPEVRFYTAPRFEVPFHTVGSLRYEQFEMDLLAYSMPITEIIRRNVVNDIEEVEDRVFLNHMEAGCQALQKDANGVAFTAGFTEAKALTARNVNDASVVEAGKCKGIDVVQNTSAATDTLGAKEAITFPLQKDDLLKLRKLFTGNGGRGSRLRCAQILISDTDFEDISAWTISDVGDKIAGETTVDGFKYKTVVNGTAYTRTLKTDILRPGNIYGFAPSEFLGGFMILNKLRFYADKVRTKISFEAWEDIGMYLGNVAGVRKLELYAGTSDAMASGEPGAVLTAAFAATKQPVAEDQLGKLNNLVEEGVTFPSVQSF